MSCRIDTASLIAGACVIGNRGLGVLGGLVPSTGEFGAPPLYNDISLPSEAGDEFRWEFITLPAGLVFVVAEDSSMVVTASGGGVIPDGAYAGSGKTYKNGVVLPVDLYGLGVGISPFTITIGTGAPADITPPTLTLPTATPTSDTTASGTVTTDDGTGTLYRLASTNATESAATVKAAALTQAVTATGLQSVTFTSLAPATAQYAHYVHTDAAGNDSARVSSAQFTTPGTADTAAPTFSGSLTITVVSSTSLSVLCPTATDGVGVIAYDCSTDGGATWPYTSATTTVLLAGVAEYSSGTVHARARDASGNVSASLAGAYLIPLPPPTPDPAPATLYTSFTSLRTSLARWMHRDDLADMLPEFIALAEARLNRDIRFLQQLRTIDLIAASSSALVTMPTTWLEWQRLRLVNPDRELQWITPGQRVAYRPASDAGSPVAYTIEGNALALMPRPDRVYHIDATYYARLPTLSDTNPTTWLMTAHPSLYLWAVLSEASLYVRDTGMSDGFLARYAQDLAAAKTADNAARHSGSPLRVRAR